MTSTSRSFRWDRGRGCDGLCRVVVGTGPRTARVQLAGNIPNFALPQATALMADAVRTARASSGSLTWSFRLGKGCPGDVPSTCSGYLKGWRRCK